MTDKIILPSFRNRRRKAITPPLITIASITWIDASNLRLLFNGWIQNLPSLTPGLERFEIWSDSVAGWTFATDLSGSGDQDLFLNSMNELITPGAAWRVVTYPEGLTFQGGGLLLVPQSGNLI